VYSFVYIIIIIDKWSPALQIRTVLLSIQALLSAPNPDDPLANDVASHWKEDEKGAIEQGKFIYIIYILTVILTSILSFSPCMDCYVCSYLETLKYFKIKNIPSLYNKK
jgi:hypothetical protein